MKAKYILFGMLAAALTAVVVVGCASEKHEQAELRSEAKITKDQAQQTALDKVPGGTIKEGELEKENGKLIWSFDIATANTRDITEVAVDALSGALVSVSKETPAEQAKEKD